MSDERPLQPPRPGSRPGIRSPSHRDLVGPENEDVTDLSPREIILRNYDATLYLRAGMRLDMDALKERVKTIEQHLWPGTVAHVPIAHAPTTHQTLSGTGHKPLEWDRRRHVDALTEFNPEDTDHGSTRLPPGMFQALQQKVTQLEADKAESEAYAAGQEDVRRSIEKASIKQWDRARKWLIVLTPILLVLASGVGFLVKHLIDTQPTPVYTPPKLLDK